MIVKIGRPGKSFKGAALYLAHDIKAKTSDRVGWTHSLNTANDTVLGVVNEMYQTYRASNLLKVANGYRASDILIEKPVKQVSLNWPPGFQPSKAEMIEAAQSYLEHLGWSEHEAMLFMHLDKPHLHVHILINAVHPVTGLKLDDGFEKRRTGDWRRQYSREHGHPLTSDIENGYSNEPSPTREDWLALKEFEERIDRSAKKTYSRDYLAKDAQQPFINDGEWKILKEYQRKERKALVEVRSKELKALGKLIYENVEHGMKPMWNLYFECKRAGMEASALHELKQDIKAYKKDSLEGLSERYCGMLKESFDEDHKHLLERQKVERAELRRNQEVGRASPHLLDRVGKDPLPNGYEPWQFDMLDPHIEPELPTAKELIEEYGKRDEFAPRNENEHQPRGGRRDIASSPGDLGLSALGALATLAERFFDGLFGGNAKTPANDQRKPVQRKAPVQRQLPLFTSDPPATDVAEREAEERAHEYFQKRRRSRDR